MENICQNIQEQIPELITGTLPTEKVAELERHIDSCPACREYLEALQGDDKLLSGLAGVMRPSIARVENNVIDALEHRKPKKSVHTISVWRMIMKSRIIKFGSAAAIIFCVLGLLVFFGNGETLYAQVIKAIENARTIHAVTKSLDKGQWEKNTEVWYQQGKGIVETSWRYGEKTYIRIDNGQYMWKYRAGDDYAKRSKTIDPMGVARKLLNVDSFKKQAIRDPSEDKVVNGIRYLAYVRSNPENTYRIVTWLDEAKRVRAWEKIHLLDSGQWETYRIGEVEYNVELSPKVFTPDFGEDIEIVEVDTKLDEYFRLEDAIFTKEALGLMFAVHELARCQGDLIFAVSSIRPADTWWDIARAESGRSGVWHYGSFQFGSSWKRLDNYGRGCSYQPITLGEIYHADLQVEWTLFVPQGFETEDVKECELEIYMYNHGALAKKRAELDLPTRERFKPIAILPLPKESVALAQVMDKVYSIANELEQFVAFDRLTLKKVPFTDEEMEAWVKENPSDWIAERWLSGDKNARLSHARPSKPSQISKEDWVKDRMDCLQEIKNNYKEFLQEVKKREQGSR